MEGNVDRLREWLRESPSGFNTRWADALEDASGDAYRALERAYRDAVQAASLLWGQPTFQGNSRDLPDEDKARFQKVLCWRWRTDATLTLWRRPGLAAAVALESHDADTLRTILVVCAPASSAS